MANRKSKLSEIDPGVRLAGMVIAGALTAFAIGSATWVVTSINGMKETLTRMDERQIVQSPVVEKRFADLEGRVGKLENDGKGIRQ